MKNIYPNLQKKSFLSSFFLLGMILLTSVVTAQTTFTFTSSPNVAIPDDAYNGTLGSMASSSITATGVYNNPITNIELDVQIGDANGHTWVGDLIIKLQAPDGTILAVMSRPGLADVGDNGADCCGDGDDWGNGSVITFSDAGVTDAEAMGAAGGVVCSGNGLCSYFPNPGSIAVPPAVDDFSDLYGLTMNGNWTLYVGDGGGGDNGNLQSWTLRVTSAAPVNDLCIDAISIPYSCILSTISGNNLDATNDAPAPSGCGTGGSTNSGVWYTIVGDGGNVTLSTCSFADFDTKIVAYTGSCGSLTCVNGNDDFCGLQSELTFATTNGTTYYILVQGFGSSEGNFDLTVDFEDNDPVITCGGNITVDNATGTCASAFIDLTGSATATDDCSVPTVTYSPTSGNFPIGTTTVTATATDGAGNTSTCTFDVIVTDIDAPVVSCSPFTLHDNGSLVNSSGTGFGGADESMLQTTSLGMGILGFGHDVDAGVRIADDFTVTNSNGWDVNEIVFYAYQTNSGTTSTISHVNLRIWDGVPGGGGTVVWGDGATNLLVSTEWTGIYRVTETTSGNVQRAVMKNTISLGGVNLPAGTYWLDWQSNGTLASGPWAPPVTITGQSTTGNGLQSLDGGVTYAAVSDIGGQDFPFIIFGNQSVENDLGDCGAAVTINAPVVDDCSSYTATNDFNGTSDASDNYPVGTTTVTWTITDDDNNSSTCSFDVTVEDTEAPSIDCAIIGGGNATVASSNVPLPIIDAGSMTSTLTVPFGGSVTDVNVLNLQGTHTWVSDVEIALTSPQGTTVTLLNNSCGSNDNFDLNFDDAGAAHGTISCGTPMGAGGTYQPFAALSAFNGEDPSGVWTLTVYDQVGADVGTLTAWSLQVVSTGSNVLTVSNDAGVCEAAVTVPVPTFGDNCTGSTIENDFNNTADASGTYPVGTTTVTWTATDVAGNTNTCTMDVVVEDTEDPTVTCPGDIAIDNNPGDCGAVVTFTATSTDNCPGETIAFSPASGSFFAVGTTEVTATATDAAGNTATCTFNVTVSDTEEPSLVCPTDILVSNDAGLCTANVTYTAPVGVDNCEPVVTQSLSQSILGGNSVSCNAGGLHTNNSYMRVFDLPALGYTNDFYINSVDVGIEQALGAGGSQPATVNLYSLAGPLTFANLTLLATEAVTVADQTLSVLNIPLTSQLTVPAGTVLVVEFFTPDGQGAGHSLFVGSNNLGQTGDSYLAAADCGIAQPTATSVIGFPDMHWVLNVNAGTLTEQTAGLGSGADFPVGTTTETYQSTDVYGNVATCSFDVEVEDVEVPTIDCGSDPIVCDIYASTNVPVTLADVTTSTSTLTVSGAGISINDLNVLGLQGTHTWVSDLTVSLTSPVGTTVQLWSALCGSADDFDISLDDEAGTGIACPINVGNTEIPVNALSAFDGENPNGVWTITFTDGAGGDVGQLNAWSLEICTGTGGTTVYTQSNDIGDCGAVVTIAAPATSDNCPLTLTNDYNNTSDATDFYPVGTTVVEWTVTDPSGNTASCSVTVVVTDDEFPVITCPPSIVADNDEGQCGAIVTFAAPTATDNCPLPAIAQFSDNSGLSIPDGDPSGTSAQQTVAVTGTNLGTDVFLQSVCLNVSHTWVGDLEFVLESPNGDLITLMSQPGGGNCTGDNLDVCFVPGTGSPLSGGTCANAPAYSGDYNAEGGDLAALSTSTDPNGTWTLYAYDYVSIDAGSVNNWTLSFLDLGGTPAPIQTAGLPSGSEFPVGTTTNTFEVTDASGNTSTCSFDVEVSDVEAPAITCPGDIEVDNDAGVCGAVVDYDAPTGFQPILEQLGNNFENGFVSNTTFPNVGADNFVVADGDCYDISNVTANFFVTSPTAVSSFDVIFYDDNSGEPGNVLNTVNLTSSQWTTSYQGSNFGFDIYEYDFNFPSAVTLCGSTGGTPYWMSVVANGTAGFDYFWEVSTLGDYGSEGVLAPSTSGPWDDSQGIDFVFGLNDGGNTPDNCVGPVTVTQTDGTGFTDGDEFPIGTTLQEYTAEDQYGNVSVCSFNVVVNDTEAPVITCADDIIACDGDVVTFTVTTSDNCPGEVLVQTAGLPSGSVFPLGITTNTFEVTDASGNTATCSFDVNVTPVPVADFTYAPSCVGEIIYFTSTATVDPSGGTSIVSHEWEFNDGSGINTDVNPTHVYNTAGDYDVTLVVTTNWGCTDTITYTVTVSDPPVYTIDVVEPTCNGDENGSITINVTGGNSPITFSLNGGPAQSENVFSGLAAGTYSITLANGCTETVTVTIGEPDALVIGATSQPALCFGDATGSIEVTATGGTGVLQYSVDGGNTFQPTGSFNALAAGTYVVVVEDENGCSISEGVVITEPTAALAATAEVQNVSCTGDASGSVVVSATGGTGAYTYSSDGGTTTQSSNVFADLAAGDYTITVTDANGCTADVDVTVEEPAELLTIETTPTPVSCNGEGDGMIDVTATGGGAPYEYSFNGGITYQSSGSFTDLAPGTYTVVVRDANGCEVASIVVVGQPDALTLSETASSPSSCEGDNDGSFTVTAEGGTGPYTYTSNGNSNSTGEFTNVTSGTQLVTVTDASDCSATVEVEVGYTNPLPVAEFIWFASGSVVQFSNLSTNGTSYSWNFGDGSTSTDQNPVHTYAAGGTYTVTLVVTNACGSDTITLTIDTNNIGINDPNAGASVLNVYPNPNHGQFTLNYTSTGVIGDIQVNVMTIEGKLLMAEQFTVNADTFVRNYSDIELAAGIYIVQFISQTGTEVKRITVDK